MIRVVVTGSECTGKTTLAADLAARLSVPWVPEYARQYVAATRDTAWLRKGSGGYSGERFLREMARFWFSRPSWNATKQLYEINGQCRGGCRKGG